ncbi:MAG: hypothetical protein ACRC3B_23710 [Bacteroidia bacterium]
MEIGTVIKVFLSETKPPKEKRLIIIGESFDKLLLATVFINSEININVFRTQELRDLNVLLEAQHRNYLRHDSYVDCSKIFVRNKETISTIITNDPSRILGTITQEDYLLLRNKIKTAKTISAAKKKEFGLFL